MDSKLTFALLFVALALFTQPGYAQDDKAQPQGQLTRGQLAIPIDKSAKTDNKGTPVQDAKLEAQAVDALAAHLSTDSGSITMVSMAARDWPDSSLGCPKPGHQYLDVITPGYQAVLQVGQKTYRVNLTKNYAVVCDSLNLTGPKENIPAPGAETE